MKVSDSCNFIQNSFTVCIVNKYCNLLKGGKITEKNGGKSIEVIWLQWYLTGLNIVS